MRLRDLLHWMIGRLLVGLLVLLVAVVGLADLTGLPLGAAALILGVVALVALVVWARRARRRMHEAMWARGGGEPDWP